MTGIEKRAKMTVFDFEGRFILYSKWGKLGKCSKCESIVTLNVLFFFFLSRIPYFLLVNGISNKLHASFKKETDNHELN